MQPKIDVRQLSLFERQERAAILEYDAGLSKELAERKSGVFYRGPIHYLFDLIKGNYPLIHLFGDNPNLCLVRSLTADEPEIAKNGAWMARDSATSILKSHGYSCTRHLHTEIETGMANAETWHKKIP